MAARKARRAQYVDESTDPRVLEYFDRYYEGVRKGGAEPRSHHRSPLAQRRGP
jgi:hypothetical protein